MAQASCLEISLAVSNLRVLIYFQLLIGTANIDSLSLINLGLL